MEFGELDAQVAAASEYAFAIELIPVATQWPRCPRCNMLHVATREDAFGAEWQA
jgi:hypothetical protein